MNYTEEDIRDAFKAGLIKGKHQSYFDAPPNEDEYIEELKRVKNNFVLADVSGRSELFDLLKWMKDEPLHNIDDIDEILDDYEYYKSNNH